MTIQAVFGGELFVDFATNRGMGDFTRWVDGLDTVDFPELTHLVDWGWVNRLELLHKEIKSAKRKSPPTDSVSDTVDNFSRELKLVMGTVETVMIANGLGPDDDTSDSWEQIEQEEPEQ